MDTSDASVFAIQPDSRVQHYSAVNVLNFFSGAYPSSTGRTRGRKGRG